MIRVPPLCFAVVECSTGIVAAFSEARRSRRLKGERSIVLGVLMLGALVDPHPLASLPGMAALSCPLHAVSRPNDLCCPTMLAAGAFTFRALYSTKLIWGFFAARHLQVTQLTILSPVYVYFLMSAHFPF
jgi:hypothetical protein